MPQLSTSKTYADGDILFESDLDQIRTDIETFLNTTKIDDENIQDSGITASDKLVDASISTAKIAASAITTSKLADDAVTAAKLADDAVLTANILAANVTTAKIADSAVTTAKINDAAVTQAKRAALGQQVSSSSAAFSTSSASYTDITNLTVTITTTGRPVYLAIIPVSGPSYIRVANSGGATATAFLKLVRDSTDLAVIRVSTSAGGASTADLYTNPSVVHIDVPSAGTYTYKVQGLLSAGTALEVAYTKLVAYEL